MQRQDLINKLLSANAASARSALIRKNAGMIDLVFARELKETFYGSWTTAPQKTLNAAAALEELAKLIRADEAKALASWVRGIADLTDGKIEKAVRDLDKAAAIFLKIEQEHNAAQTQVAKLIALAMLGKYDEAIKTGENALSIFKKYEDELAAGKIEKNLGNIAARQGKETAGEKYYLAARHKFLMLGNKSELAMCDNSLANTYAELNNFHKAEKYYAMALDSAKHAKMHVTEAEIEASMGNLALFRGQLYEALRFLELSRQKYDNLNMPHQTAIAELEIADIYLELNLPDEALLIYEKVAGSFKRLKLQGEEARARANFGKAALQKNDARKAKQELERASRLFILEKNPIGAANVKLTEAALELTRKNYKTALTIISDAKPLLTKTENLRQKLFANWLHGEILRNLKRTVAAKNILTITYAEAVRGEQQNLAQACLNSLGHIALQTDDNAAAKGYFKKAVEMIETLRAPLAAEEFRMSFMANKLAPFESLARIYLADNDLKRAFLMIEKAKARTLSENLSSDSIEQDQKASPKLGKKLSAVREELNWYYSRLNRAEAGEFESLQKEVRTRERQIADVMRQIGSTRTATSKTLTTETKDDLKLLQNALGEQKALIEFVSFDGLISAFVVTGKRISHVANLARENEIHALIDGLQFQFGSLRFGKENLAEFMPDLKKRAGHYFRKLYEKLIQPLENLIGDRNLVVVPAGPLHYVPFSALNEGERYLIETREVVNAPSAAVWRVLSEKPSKKLDTALLMGFADESIPLVNAEIAALKRILPQAKTFTGKNSTFEHYRENAKNCDILHLACHGQFRPDNPMFSSLHLADGFITVGDICAQELKAEVVTLSACETGLNKIFAGEEILGLARGFISAGATSLVLSLWTVNDDATLQLMKGFYTNLQRGLPVAASLRIAQCAFIDRGEHPYYWSSFAAIGR